MNNINISSLNGGGGGGNSLSIIRSLTKDIHVNIFDKILNNNFDGLFPLDYYTRMDSTWNAPNVSDWSALQNNTSGNCIQVVVDADKSGYGNTFFIKHWIKPLYIMVV